MSRTSFVPRALRRAALLLLAAGATACGRKEESPREPTPAHAANASSAGQDGAATQPTASASPADSAARTAADRARVRGDSAARVWVVMISDFQCPYCKMWQDSTASRVVDEYVRTGKVRLAYINFPLPSHQNAWPSAQAAMCAGAQGKFWAMHDALFATQDRWSGMTSPEPLFDSLATSAGVDAKAMRQCVGSNVMRPLIQADLDRSSRAGVNSTPTFLVGDSVIAGAYPIDRFRTVIDAALAKQ
jgi:protein-disulfide isomerase